MLGGGGIGAVRCRLFYNVAHIVFCAPGLYLRAFRKGLSDLLLQYQILVTGFEQQVRIMRGLHGDWCFCSS